MNTNCTTVCALKCSMICYLLNLEDFAGTSVPFLRGQKVNQSSMVEEAVTCLQVNKCAFTFSSEIR